MEQTNKQTNPLISYRENRPPEDAIELVDVYKVLGHVRGKDHVDHALPDLFVRVAVQVLEDVDAVVGHGQLEAERRVVVLQHSDVVVQRRQLSVGVAEESTRIKQEKKKHVKCHN